MDGFHLPNAELDTRSIIHDGKQVPLRSLKGSPETYDLPALTVALRALRTRQEVSWPRYDRIIHDPIRDAMPVTDASVLVLEGNYLLLDEPGWRDLRQFVDYTIFIDVPEVVARRALLRRHQRGGRTAEEARASYERTDLPNRLRIIQHRLPADAIILWSDTNKRRLVVGSSEY